MGFFHPGAWCWGGLAALIALLYLWNLAPVRHEVATYWLWQRALARRPAWFRLRFWLSLATQILLLLLLVAALSEPYWRAAVASRRTLVLVLDVSASMSATDVKPSRLAAAQAEAQRIVQGLQPGERMAVLSAGSSVRIECRMTSEPLALQTAIDEISPTDGGTRMSEAIALARRMLDGQANPHLVLLTDGGFPEAEAIAKDEQVYLYRVGQGGRNLAVTQLAARPDPLDPQQQWVLVETANSSDAPESLPLNVAITGGASHQADVGELAAGAVVQTVLEMPIDKDGLLTAQLAVEDDLAADNQARIRVAGRQRPKVVLVADPRSAVGGHMAVPNALASFPGIDLQVVEQLPETLPQQSLVVFHGSIPQRLPDCPLLVIAPQSSCDLWDTAGLIRGSECAVVSQRRDSPLLAGVRLEDAVVEEAVKLQFKQAAATLVATSSGDPLYSLVDRPAASVLVLHVDLRKENSDLALRRDFPRLIEQALCWLNGVAEAPTVAVASDDLGILAEDAKAQGINIVNRWESDLRAGINVPSRSVESPAAVREQPLWMLLAGLAVVLLLTEWCLFHRKFVV
jgi:hypothetical protein